MMFHCKAGKSRYRKVCGESDPIRALCPGHGRVSVRRLSRVLCLNILCVLCEPGEAASLCDRHRRVFDPGYLASSTLSQPLEPSQGN